MPETPNLTGLQAPGSASGPMPTPNPGTPVPLAPEAQGPMPTPNAPPPPDSTGAVNPAMGPNPPGNMAPPNLNPSPPQEHGTTGGHGRLLSMIQGLAVGLSAFGAAATTGGREGGAKEVIAVQGEQQRQKIAAQEAQRAQKEADLRFQLMAAETQQAQGNVYALLHKLPDEISQAHTAAEQAKTNLSRSQQEEKIQLADFQAAHGGATPDQWSQAMSSPDGVVGQNNPASSFVKNQAQQSLDAAKTSGLAESDPYFSQLNDLLTSKTATAPQIWQATQLLDNQSKRQGAALDELHKRQAADPLYKLETDPNEMTGDKAPAAVAMLSERLNDPLLPPDQKPRVARLLSMAQKAQANALEFKEAEERTKQAITDGDPKAAGALLYAGLASPQELTSSRKPQFAQQALDEAVRLGGGVKDPVTGKWTGGTWSATKAEAQYEYAKNPKTQNTLNLLETMQQPGGSIDIAQKLFNQIPGKIDFKTFNGIMNGAITQFGGKSTVDFQAAMTSLADEYAQVLQGGAATETTLRQAKDLINAAYSKNQGAGAFDTIRLDMAARQQGMIRDNPALKAMYPERTGATSAPAGATSEVWQNGKLVGHVVDKKYVPLGQ